MKPWVKKVLFILLSFLILYLYYPLVNLLTYTNQDYNQAKYNILNAENKALKEKLNVLTSLEYDDYNYSYGKVLTRELYNFTEEIIIKTSKEVAKGNIVLNNNGVVGVVSNINHNLAHIKLLTNKDVTFSIKVNDEYGKLIFKDKLILEGISKDKVSLGDNVYTSGLTNYPANLLLGKITKIDKYIEIESLALSNISNVLILEGVK